MSSENKKSKSSLLLILLSLLMMAGIGWFLFNNKPASQDASPVSENVTETSEEETAQKQEEGHDGHDHAHDHQASASNASQTGMKGKIHKLNPPAIYGDRSVGDPNAPVKIQEFFSLTCNHCASFHKETYQEIKSKLIDTGKVYFTYQEFPLNGPALYGSMIARCLPEERYVGFIDLLLRQQDQWAFGGDFKAALMQHAKLAGMSEEEFDTCFNNAELRQALGANIKEASETWKINSTPSFVVNDGERVLLGAKPYETFEKIVEELTGEKISLEDSPAVNETPENKE